MHQQCLIAEFENTQKARLGLLVLSKAGFGQEQVSFVSRSDDPELDNLGKLKEGGADNLGSVSAAGMGGLLGGALAAPIAASTLIGPFILVGPLVGIGLGAALGSALGGAQHWGVDEDAGRNYEQKVEDGAVLVIVNGDQISLREAEASLKTTGPVSLKRFARPESVESDARRS